MSRCIRNKPTTARKPAIPSERFPRQTIPKSTQTVTLRYMSLPRAPGLLVILIQDKELRTICFGREACLPNCWGPSARARGRCETESGPLVARGGGNELWKTSGDSFGPKGHTADP